MIPKNPAKFMEIPQKSRKHLDMGWIHLSISLLSVQQKN